MVDVFHPSSTVLTVWVDSQAYVVQIFPCRQYVLLHAPIKELNLVRGSEFPNPTKVVILGRVVVHA